MKLQLQRKKCEVVIFIFVIIFLIELIESNVNASVVQGRVYLFNNGDPTYSGIFLANEEFKSAIAANPTDQEANLFYAVTRILVNVMDQGNAPNFEILNTIGDLLGAFGMIRNDVNLVNDGYPFTDPPEINDQYDPPTTIPNGEKLRDFLAGHFINLLDAAITNLELIDSTINISLTAVETGEDGVEIDYGDVMLYKSFLGLFKSFIYIISAYNLDVDIEDLLVRANNHDFQFQRDLLDRYQDFLKLRDIHGTTSLTNAKDSLFKGINNYRNALNFIKSESDFQGDDLFYFDAQEDLDDAESFLSDLTEVQNSLNENRPAVFDDFIDFNSVLGNSNKSPLDIRMFLPAFDIYNDIIPCSFPGDPVLNGIYPDLQTNNDIIDRWDLQIADIVGICAYFNVNNFQITIPCIDIFGTNYSIILNYYTNSEIPVAHYWMLYNDSVKIFEQNDKNLSACSSLNFDNLQITIPCIDIIGTNYSIILDSYDNLVIADGLYWRLDLNSIKYSYY